MKKYFNLFSILMLSLNLSAQTPGTLTFSYTPVSHNGYSGAKNVLAIWIRKSDGTFVKTKIKNSGWGTSDHLPVWAVNAGGSSFNNMSSVNTTDGVTGATLTNFTSKSITWDGRGVNGTSNGSIVPDGTYKVAIESVWNHNGGGAYREFTFTKGINADVQTPSSDNNFTNINLSWQPTLSVVEIEKPKFTVFPNPTSGIVKVNYENISSIQVIDLNGQSIFIENFITVSSGNKVVDLSNIPNGLYTVICTSKNKNIYKKIVVQH